MLTRTVRPLNPEIEHLVESLLPQARSEAWRRFSAAPQQLDLDEMTSLAYTGLMMAAARWDLYCSEHGFDAGCGQVPCADPQSCGTRFFAAYALRRMRGAMLDAMRSSDWVTRSTRARAKALRDAGQDLGKTEQQLVAETGLTARQVRDTQASVARRPVSMDAEAVDVAEHDDVEGQAVVHSILGAVVEAIRALPPQIQVVIALRWYRGLELRQIAELLECPEAQVAAFNAEGILAVHDAMLHQASD